MIEDPQEPDYDKYTSKSSPPGGDTPTSKVDIPDESNSKNFLYFLLTLLGMGGLISLLYGGVYIFSHPQDSGQSPPHTVEIPIGNDQH